IGFPEFCFVAFVPGRGRGNDNQQEQPCLFSFHKSLVLWQQTYTAVAGLRSYFRMILLFFVVFPAILRDRCCVFHTKVGVTRQESRCNSRARVTAWVRRLASNFNNMFDTWVLMVLSDTYVFSA